MNTRIARNTSTVPATHLAAVKSVASAGTPEALTASETLVHSVWLFPKRGNTTAVYVGSSSTNDAPSMLIGSAGVHLKAPPGTRINLALLYVDVATNGEGVAYEAMY